MKYCRFSANNSIKHGIIDDTGYISEITGNIFSEYIISQTRYRMSDITLLSPVIPSKVVCVGLNYKAHAAELNMKIPDTPVLFMKPKESVIGPNEEIIYPAMSKRVDYEAELAIVIGRKTKNIDEETAHDYILGYTCANDVTARDLQNKDGQWTRAKGFDTFCPLGPIITNEIDPNNCTIEAVLNEKIVQKSNTSDMIFTTDYLVSFISRIMTLNPGDVIITGTPPGIGPMEKGATIEIKIEGIGALTNTVI